MQNIEKNSGWRLINTYKELPSMFYSSIAPTPVASPHLVVLNHPLAKDLGLEAKELEQQDALEIFAGNKLPVGASPIAQAYAGHQFGHFTMLGDGRAILLGEQITPTGKLMDIQLKGSGPTPYSRGGDGRAAIGPMLREYIISEAMFALGIPTTRSLAVITTGEDIYRESSLPGAVLARVAASHLRVGTFQYAARWGNTDELKALADYAINRHYSELLKIKAENRYLSFLIEVIKNQARLVAQWQLVGFIHGVMNTDNMTISGETIDYGPCAFMDTYDTSTVFSSIDRQGRYAYGNQPGIAQWNLARLADALLPLIDKQQEKAISLAEEAIAGFEPLFNSYWTEGMKAKLGIFNSEAQDEALIGELLKLMQESRADYTNTFRALTLDKYEDMEMFKATDFIEWRERWQKRLERQGKTKADIGKLMMKSNPSVIPRNHRVEAALEAATRQDYSAMAELVSILRNPYEYTPEKEAYASLPPANSCKYQTFCGT